MSLITDVISKSTTISYSTTSGGSYTAIGEVKEIAAGKITAAEIGTTSLGDAAHTSTPGIPDFGEITVKFQYAGGITTTMIGYMNAQTHLFWKITPHDGTSDSVYGPVEGWIKSFEALGSQPVDALLMGELVIKTTGAVTFTAGA